MEKTHWKKLQNPDYLGAYALDPGQEIILTIKIIKNEVVCGPDGKKEECTVARWEEDSKPMILNATNLKTIAKTYKTPYIEEWQGRKIQIYIEKVKAFGEVVEALRIRPFIPKVNISPSTGPAKCVDCGKEISGFGEKTAAQIAQYTYQKYGKAICSDCAAGIAEKNKTEDVLL